MHTAPAAWHAGAMPELFGHMPSGESVYRMTLESGQLRVEVLTFGAVLRSIEAPDRTGVRANVTLGLDSLDDYVKHSPHFGAVPGRYAGRIARGRFTLDGTEYQLACNNGPNAIHGGPTGFGKRAWTVADQGRQHVALTVNSPDGDEGYPGALMASVVYSLVGNSLSMDFYAETTRPTVVNLTNHSYFNLAGEGSGSVLGHLLTVDADRFAVIDGNSIPTGELRSVEHTPFDFRTPRRLEDCIRYADPQLLRGMGYDHGFVLAGSGLRRAAVLHHERTGRTLTVHTTQPSLQLYTGNTLTGALAGPSGRAYRQSDGVCLEAQYLPDSPNRPEFPSTVLRPGYPFKATTVFCLTAESE